ncbi:uncharacterized protein LOC132307748 [Cornus florida]|uniref:uncharacterized protein LOC132307748 n=1 Tax=Cornus florida TaxID=4283 RepID=UPI00289A2447|nr:uncharacterized protein LOC132307748 [Cornus florida]XP_059661577.1 uncharacterized protein LOC132307748 [Cornus florida]XP_059661578.1 uncharacterized protein LOC132307748 [Cornus florida]
MAPSNLNAIRFKNIIPNDVSLRIYPTELDGSSGEGLFHREVLFSTVHLNIIRFHLHPFFCYVFSKLGLCPLQVNPNFLRVISVILLLNRDRGLNLDIIDLLLCYQINKIKQSDLYYHFFPIDKRLICTDKNSFEKGWRQNLIGVSGNWRTLFGQSFSIPSSFGVCSVSGYKKLKTHPTECHCESCLPRFCTFLCRCLQIPHDELVYSVYRAKLDVLQERVLNNGPLATDLLTPNNLSDISFLGFRMESIQIPSFSKRRRSAPIPSAAPVTISSSTPATTSSTSAVSAPEQVVISPVVTQVTDHFAVGPSELTHAENLAVDHSAEAHPAASIIVSSNILSDTSSENTQDAGGSQNSGGPVSTSLSEKSFGKRPMPEGGHDQSDVPPARRTRTASFRITLPPARFLIPEGESPRTSGPISSVLTWRPLLSREDGSTIGPTNSMYKDPLTSFAFYKGFWIPKDLEIQNKLSFGEMFQRFPTVAMEVTFLLIEICLFSTLTF